MERMLPNNIDAEKGVLGSIIIDPDAFDLVSDILHPDDFYANAHTVIYEAMTNLSRRRIAPDFLTILDELERTEKIKDAGREDADAASYITSMINLVPTSGNASYYANIVSRTAQSRRVIRAATMIVQLGYDNDPNALDKSEKLLYTIRRSANTAGFVGMRPVMNEYMDELDYLHEHRGSISGVPTGYTDLDLCLGGLQRSDLILLAARPSMGKTSLALGMAYKAALKGKKVAIFSLEMGRRLLARRMMAMKSHVDMQRLRNGWIEDDEWEMITESYASLSDLPIWINDTAGNPIASMRSELRRLSRENGGIDEVIVDYVGLIEPDEDGDKRANIVQQISMISKGLKGLAREFDVPVVALCQLSRAVESRQVKIPMLSDLRDSGSLEQDADVVLFIYRDDYYHQADAAMQRSQGRDEEPYTPTNLADIIIAKHRNGPTGEIQLYWQADETMFYGLDEKGEGNE
jgi:replicative DNA helicase